MPEPLREKNPYVGPRAFTTGEEMYGRKRETRELLDLLIAERIVLLHSPSGAGKSSLIQAKLIPALQDERFQVLPIVRVNEPPPEKARAGAFNRYVFSTLRCLESDVPADQRLPLETLFEMRLPDYLDQQLSSSIDRPGSTVLIFDQFEEIVSLDPIDQSAKADFFAQVGQALRDRRRWALFAMRGDYKAAIESYARPIPTRLENVFSLGLLGPDAAREAIQEPARKAGVDFVDSAVQKLVDDLRMMRVQQIDGSFDERPGPNVEPVQLQVVCFRLWQRLPPEATQITDADIEAVGEVDDALAGYYTDVVQAVSEKTGVRKRLIRAWFEDQLITKQGMRSQVLLEQEQSGGLDNRAIDLLKGAYLVRADIRSGSTWYELAHDRLIAPIRMSNAEWFNTNLSLLQKQADLWRRAGKPPTTMLLRDAALDEAAQWAAEHNAELIDDERDLLNLSLDARQNERDRLQAAERLAEEQAQAAQRLRARNRIVQRLGIAALFLSMLAIIGFIVALKYASDARQSQAIAEQKQHEADQQKTTAEAATQAETKAKAAVNRLLDAGIVQADSVQLAGYASSVIKPDLALLLSLEAMQVTDTVEAKSSLIDGLMRNPHLVTFLRGPADRVNSVAFSPDGKTVAVAGSDGLHLWDAITGTPISTSIKTESIASTAFSPDSRLLAAKDDLGGMTLWEWASGTPRTLARVASDLGQELDAGSSVVFSPDGKLLATSGYDYDSGGSTIFVWDIASGQLLSPTLTYSPPYVSRLAFDPDSKTLAAGYEDGAIVLWDIASGKTLTPTFSTGASQITLLKFIQDDLSKTTTLVSADDHGKVTWWDTKSGQQEDEQNTGLANTSADSSANAQKIVFGGNNILTVRDGGANRTPLNGHAKSVTGFALSPDGSRLVSGDEDGQVILWRTSGNARSTLLPHENASPVNGAAYNRDGNTLVSVDNDRIIVWNASTGQMPTVTASISLELPSTTVIRAMALSANGGLLALSTSDQDSAASAISLWDLNQRRQITEVLTHTAGVNSLAFNPNGRELVSSSTDGNLITWNAADGQLRLVKEQPQGIGGQTLKEQAPDTVKAGTPFTPTFVAFSPDGQRLVVGYEQGKVTSLDPESLDHPYEKEGEHQDTVTRIAFDSADNFATGSNNEINLWSGASLTPTLMGSVPRTDSSAGDLTSLAFSPDGKTLLEGTSSGAIVLWDITDVARPRRIAEFTGHSGPVTTLAFSPDGESLVSGSDDGTLQLWPMRFDGWKVAACNLAARNLTWREWDRYFPPDQPYHVTCNQLPVNTGEIVTGYLERATRDGVPESSQWFTRALELSNQSQDFYAAQPICEFSLKNKLGDMNRQTCQRAVELSLQADNYDQTLSICQLGTSNDLKDVVLPACTRTVELSLQADRYDQIFSLCRLGISNDLSDVVLPACTRAGELSVASGDHDRLYSFCRFGVLHNQREAALPACTRAIELDMRSSDDYFSLFDACELGELAGLSEAASTACTHAAELSVKSNDYYQLYDMCALGAFFKQGIDFPTVCQTASELALGPERLDKAEAGYLYALAGKIDRAKSLFKEAEQEALSSGDATSNNYVCWHGSVTGLAEIARVVLPACDRGVNLSAAEDQPPNRDSRGVARALLGDMPGAIEDFQSLVDWLRTENATNQFDSETIDLYTEERLSFIKALEAGQNPFDDKTLYLIHNE